MSDLMSIETPKADKTRLGPLAAPSRPQSTALPSADHEDGGFDLVFAQNTVPLADLKSAPPQMVEAEVIIAASEEDLDIGLVEAETRPTAIAAPSTEGVEPGLIIPAEAELISPTTRVNDQPPAPLPGGPLQTAAAVQAVAASPSGHPAATLHQQSAPSPHAEGSKGPDIRTTQAEDTDMQLGRLNRVRSYSATLSRMALQDAATAPASAPNMGKDVTIPLRPISAPPPTLRDGTDLPRDTPAQTTGRSQTDNTPLPPRMTSLSEAVALARAATAQQGDSPRPPAPPQQATSQATARTATPAPQVLAAYSSLAPQPAQSAFTKGLIQDDVASSRFEALGVRPMDHSLTPTDTARTAHRPMPHVSPDQLAHQLAQVAQNTALHRRDILLQPEELGRVRLNLQAHENSVHVAILAERPETLDLMRRYIGQLSDEFRALGYDDVSFDFAQQGRSDSDTSDTPNSPLAPQPDLEEAAPLPTITHPGLQKTGTLDLRI